MSKSFATSLASRRPDGYVASTRKRAVTLGMLGCWSLAPVAAAQVVPGSGASIGSMAADRARVGQIAGVASDSAVRFDTLRALRPVLPTVIFVSNSQLPAGGNDGGLWAGRGANLSLTGGAAWTRGRTGVFQRLDIVVAPELRYSRNRPFPTFPGREPGRSAFSSPWHIGQSSADLPLRFGDQPTRAIGIGQSSVTLTTDRVAFGAASTNEWWGPSLRNTLLLSNNAAGVPRLFARTARPIRTRFGSFEARAIIGGLTESPYFDENATNDVRSLSGLLLTYRPALDTGLTLGLSRLVMARSQSDVGVLGHVFDAVFRYQPIRAEGDTSDAGESYQTADQLFSLFARWVFPSSGFETWAEWARMELPRSWSEYLEAPQNTQGYTLGFQWANPQPQQRYFRLQGEVTYLEQTQVLRDRPPPDYYTGRAAVQGFTQRGQLLGAAIGPGASSQFLAADWLAPRWQVGTFVGRTRTENDAMYRLADPRLERHDVTIYSGVRGGARLPRYDLDGELTVGRRLNYLFQSNFRLGAPKQAVDVQNVTLTFRLSPR